MRHGDFAQKRNGGSSIHIVDSVWKPPERPDITRIITVCGKNWPAEVMVHVDTDGGGPADCRTCWERM